MTSPVLEFTGERFTPECVREIWYEHVHRYAFARDMARGRRVLDAACGEGYGAALLAPVASSVTAVDVSVEALAHARQRYGAISNLRFVADDVTSLAELGDEKFDLIVSFETLEHVHAQEQMLARFSQLLAADGLLLVSTPDKRVYSDATGYSNEFHVRELYLEEFTGLLDRFLPCHRLFGQKLLFQSVLWDPGRLASAAAATECGGRLAGRLDYEPVYWLAACARSEQAISSIADLHLFGDAAETVYTHYNQEIRKNMAAGARIQDLEREVDELRRRLASMTKE